MRIVLGGESYTALTEGISESLHRLGKAPKEIRTDSLAAAFKNLSASEHDDLTDHYKAFCAHYNVEATRNNRGQGHENGAVESPHGHLKRRIEQQLHILFPEVHDHIYHFESLDDFEKIVHQVVAKHNRRNAAILQEELTHMQDLPEISGVDYTRMCESK